VNLSIFLLLWSHAIFHLLFLAILGLTKGADAETFNFYRAAELKHGRVSQLAVLGYIVPELFKFPGDIAPGIPFTSIPNGVAAIEAIPALGWIQIFFLIGYVDWRLSTGKSAAPFVTEGGLSRTYPSAEEKARVETQELQHGRLAMLAILELLRHDSQGFIGGMYAGDHLITGLPFIY
jgi:hypothetical protein